MIDAFSALSSLLSLARIFHVFSLTSSYERKPPLIRFAMASVRFKFRSSATYDSIDIGEQSSISIRDLKASIVLKKHLNLSQDFDLVFSDSLSGQEYTDENIQIPKGSSVIIKRVPAKSSPSQRVFDTSAECFGKRDSGCINVHPPTAVDVGANGYEDFGIDLSPSYINFPDKGKMLINDSGKKDDVVTRCSQEVLVRCQTLEADSPVQSTPKDSCVNEKSVLVMPKPRIDESTGFERLSSHLNLENSDMPSELKCSLCRTFFKEAVMIPCCQHSFCAKCICVALSENAKCPRCSSTKCKPKDLLPNVSLRQAIERFLESKLLLNGSEGDLHRYAPDGESGIQVKDISCATTLPHRHVQLNQSGDWSRSNRKMESKQHDHIQSFDKHECEPLANGSEFQGENEPQSLAGTNYDADYCSNKGDVSRVFTRGADRNAYTPGRLHRGPRTCYMCGSPDHLIRDCPGAANSFANNWNGVVSHTGPVPRFPPPYWPGNPPLSGPYMNMYEGHGMMFYNSSATPFQAFPFSSCAPSMYCGYPVSGNMGMGGMAPRAANVALQLRPVEFPEVYNSTKQQRNYSEDIGRVGILIRDQNASTRYDCAEKDPYYSGDSFGKRSEGKHQNCDNSDIDTYSSCRRQGRTAQHPEYGRDRRISQSDRSSCDKDVNDNRIRHREDKQEQLHRKIGRNDEMIGHHGSIQKHYPSIDESSRRKRTEHDERKIDGHFYSRSRSSLERSYSDDGSRQRREETSHRSLPSNKVRKTEHKEDCGKIIYMDDFSEDYHTHKRKRHH